MPVNNNPQLTCLEVCIDSVESGVAAQLGGANRVELCDNLNEGGTTPSRGMIQRVNTVLDIPVHVMIRPRGGDFLYSIEEFEVMKMDIEEIKQSGCAGVVFGVLTAKGRIDSKRTAILTDLAKPLKTTFHRAFDMTDKPLEGLDTLIGIGFDYILSSGQQPKALDGIELLMALVGRAQNRIEIMAGSGITGDNVSEIIRRTGIRYVHASAAGLHESDMKYRNPDVSMTGAFHTSEYIRKQTDVERVRSIIKSARSGS